jgi:hypothetical protein
MHRLKRHRGQGHHASKYFGECPSCMQRGPHSTAAAVTKDGGMQESRLVATSTFTMAVRVWRLDIIVSLVYTTTLSGPQVPVVICSCPVHLGPNRVPLVQRDWAKHHQKETSIVTTSSYIGRDDKPEILLLPARDRSLVCCVMRKEKENAMQLISPTVCRFKEKRRKKRKKKKRNQTQTRTKKRRGGWKEKRIEVEKTEIGKRKPTSPQPRA